MAELNIIFIGILLGNIVLGIIIQQTLQHYYQTILIFFFVSTVSTFLTQSTVDFSLIDAKQTAENIRWIVEFGVWFIVYIVLCHTGLVIGSRLRSGFEDGFRQ